MSRSKRGERREERGEGRGGEGREERGREYEN